VKVFCVRVKGYKTAIEFFSRRDYENFVDVLGDKLANVWVEVKEIRK